MADHLEDALIREVNDDLREEQMKKLWQSYGAYVVAAAVLVVAIVAGYQGWKHYTTTTRLEEGERYTQALSLVRDGDSAGAIQALGQLGQDAASGYGVMAKFRQAALMAESGDIQGAGALYADIARTNASDLSISGLANVLGAMVEIGAGGYDPAAMRLRLQPLSGEEHPFRHSARELTALVELEAGNAQGAADILKQLATDNTAPQGIAKRARELLQGMGEQ